MVLSDDDSTLNFVPTMNFEDKNCQLSESQTPIQQFYSGKCIFVTGGTGFMGKVLLYKLLKSCPGIDTIYLLIRTKKGKDMYTRFDELFEDFVFEHLKEIMPKFRHKLVGIAGDCSLPGLGMSPEDALIIKKRVDIVFHMAATVRFNELLSVSATINIKGTQGILNLAKEIENLKVFVHVSTVFCNCISQEVEEKFYPSPMSPENVNKLIEGVSEDILKDITPRILGKWPNTYAFTKCIAEDCVQKSEQDLPIVLFRPAIVVATLKEPICGWINNIYGPTGVIVGCGAGVLRVLQADGNKTADMVPADLAINAIISSAWDYSVHKPEKTPIYNFVSSGQNRCTWGEYLKWNMQHGYKLPSIRSVWYQTITLVPQYSAYFFVMVLYHLIPGFFMDAALLISGRKPRMLKIYKKIHNFTAVIAYFATQEWIFHDNNVRRLWKKLTPDDQELFNFNITSFEWERYFADSLHGIRRFLLKDEEKTIPAAIKRMHRLKYLHYFVLFCFWNFVLWLFYTIISYIIF